MMKTTHESRFHVDVARRLGAVAVAALTMLCAGLVPVTAGAQDAANVAANTASGNDNAPEVTVSYTTSWQGGSAALNDGIDESSDFEGWGTWGNTSDSETATYTWSRAVTTSSSSVSYYTNIVSGDGGVLLPKSVELQYLNDETGEYETVSNLTASEELPEEPSESNYGPITYTFDEVTTQSLRLVLTKQATDNKGITVGEWQVFGVSESAPIDPGDPNAFLYTQDIQLRTTPGVDPTQQLPAQIWVTPENGPSVQVPVQWESIPAQDYDQAGDVATVSGTTEADPDRDLPAGAVSATVSTYDALNTEVVDVEYVSTITTPGRAPVFPDTITLIYADGSMQSGAAVQWGDVAASEYAEADQMGEVEGAIDGVDDIIALGTFFVVEPSPTDANPIVYMDFNTDALNATGWYTSVPTLTVSAYRGVSDVEITSLEYKINDGDWAPYQGSVVITQQGTVTVAARATDANGNSKEVSEEIRIDTNAPKTTATEISRVGKDVVVELAVDDGADGSGVTRTLYSTGPSSNPQSNENTMWGTYEDADKVKVQLSADHDTYVHFYSQDAAGHSEEYQALNLGMWDGTEPEIPVESITIDGDVDLVAGDTSQLTATVKPDGATDKTVAWSSSDTSVATVDENGLVTAVAVGQATITAASGEVSATVTITVTDGETPETPATDEERQELRDAIEKGSLLKESDYTAESWKVYADALAGAKAVVDNADATVADVTEALNRLADAQGQSVFATPDPGTDPGTNPDEKPGEKPDGSDGDSGDKKSDEKGSIADTGSAVIGVVMMALIAGAAGVMLKRRLA